MIVDESLRMAAPPSRVWRALTDAFDRAEWWGYIDLDVTPGGKVEEHWTDDGGHPMVTRGHVLAVAEGRMFRFAWADAGQEHPTEVEVALEGYGAATVVRIVETGWDRLPDGHALAADHRAGWRVHLTNLRRHVESDPSPTP